MSKARDLANAGTALTSVSATELGYVDGVTSAIQTQIDTKAPSSTAVTLTGTQTLTNKTLTNPVISSVVNNTLTSTTGDMIYASAANTPARLGIGTAGQVLKVNSGATAPEWGSASSAFRGCSVYGTTNGNISANSYELLAWGSENFDTDSFHSTTTNTQRITIPTGLGGKYLIQVGGAFAPATTDNRNMSLNLYVNTTQKYYSSICTTTNTPSEYYAGIGLNCILDLAAGDYLTVRAYNNDTASKPFYSNIGQGFFNVFYLGA